MVVGLFLVVAFVAMKLYGDKLIGESADRVRSVDAIAERYNAGVSP